MNYKKILFIAGCGLALSLGKINAQSATFNYTGSVQTWTVPCGVTQVTVTVLGGSGGWGGNASLWNPGGLGGSVVGVLTVASGATLDLYVGGVGGNETATAGGTAGYNGGGTGGDDANTWLGGGGGGASDIRVTPYALANRVVVAGGGGGGGDNTNTANQETGGVGGGLIGGAGYYGGVVNSNTSYCGQGGTQAAGGAGATSCIGSASGLGIGGNSCAATSGGGGGGGYYGGGCGCYAGAGGGSSYTGGLSSVTTNSQGTNTGNGSVTIAWTLPAALAVTAHTTTNETCNGGSAGSAASTVSGGGTPYTYAWTGGGTNATVSGLTAGSYTLTVHDNCGNSASASVSITQPTAIVATITSTNVTCNGGNNGSASSTVTGGTGAYTYAWTGGGSNSSITGLTAGTYNLNVQDASGCTGSATVTITQPNILVVSDSVTANVWCHGDSNGSASSKVSGGTMPYMYTWTGGGTTDTAVGLKAGTYTLAVQDANGCTGTAMVTITEPSALAIVKHATADNGSSNGKAWVNVSGGVSPYTYAWTGGNTTDSISGKAKGIYCCTVKDANGCMDSVCINIVSTAGIDGITSNGGNITVYPNPNNGQFTIQSSLNAVSTVEVYNVLGEKVFSGNLNAGNNTINMSNQSTGIYLYRVMSESGTLISEGKISVQK